MRIPASRLIGSPVENDCGEYLGEIGDLLVDLNDGEIRYAVLASRNLLGLRSKYIAVPLPLLQISRAGRCLFMESRAAVQQAPGFDQNDWPASASNTQLDIVKRYNNIRTR